MAQTKITGDMIADDAVTADKIANSINSAITANTAKVTNATHTGDVTGATALTIAVDAVDIPMLSATGSPSNTTFLRGDNAWQYICNDSSARTHTLPAGSAGDTVILANAGAGLVTIGRNGSENINSAAADGTVPQGNSAQLVYVDSTIGWFEV
jgi:hypothetical protein